MRSALATSTRALRARMSASACAVSGWADRFAARVSRVGISKVASKVPARDFTDSVASPIADASATQRLFTQRLRALQLDFGAGEFHFHARQVFAQGVPGLDAGLGGRHGFLGASLDFGLGLVSLLLIQRGGEGAVDTLADVAALHFQATGADLAVEQFRLTRLGETAAERNRLPDAGHVFLLVGGVGVERKLLRAENGFGIGERARLPGPAFGGLDHRLGFGEFGLEAFGHLQGLVEAEALDVFGGWLALHWLPPSAAPLNAATNNRVTICFFIRTSFIPLPPAARSAGRAPGRQSCSTASKSAGRTG